MLQQVCEYLHNYFIREPHCGSFSIADGMISLDFLKDGQRFWITNSDLNDGVYTYHADGIKNDDDTDVAGLSDEDFDGTICAMAVPPAVVALSGEINQWVEKYSDVVNSPYQQESFGGYSYTLSGEGRFGGGDQRVNWQSVFSSQLNRWRKVSL